MQHICSDCTTTIESLYFFDDTDSKLHKKQKRFTTPILNPWFYYCSLGKLFRLCKCISQKKKKRRVFFLFFSFIKKTSSIGRLVVEVFWEAAFGNKVMSALLWEHVSFITSSWSNWKPLLSATIYLNLFMSVLALLASEMKINLSPAVSIQSNDFKYFFFTLDRFLLRSSVAQYL